MSTFMQYANSQGYGSTPTPQPTQTGAPTAGLTQPTTPVASSPFVDYARSKGALPAPTSTPNPPAALGYGDTAIRGIAAGVATTSAGMTQWFQDILSGKNYQSDLTTRWMNNANSIYAPAEASHPTIAAIAKGTAEVTTGMTYAANLLPEATELFTTLGAGAGVANTLAAGAYNALYGAMQPLQPGETHTSNAAISGGVGLLAGGAGVGLSKLAGGAGKMFATLDADSIANAITKDVTGDSSVSAEEAAASSLKTTQNMQTAVKDVSNSIYNPVKTQADAVGASTVKPNMSQAVTSLDQIYANGAAPEYNQAANIGRSYLGTPLPDGSYPPISTSRAISNSQAIAQAHYDAYQNPTLQNALAPLKAAADKDVMDSLAGNPQLQQQYRDAMSFYHNTAAPINTLATAGRIPQQVAATKFAQSLTSKIQNYQDVSDAFKSPVTQTNANLIPNSTINAIAQSKTQLQQQVASYVLQTMKAASTTKGDLDFSKLADNMDKAVAAPQFKTILAPIADQINSITPGLRLLGQAQTAIRLGGAPGGAGVGTKIVGTAVGGALGHLVGNPEIGMAAGYMAGSGIKNAIGLSTASNILSNPEAQAILRRYAQASASNAAPQITSSLKGMAQQMVRAQLGKAAIGFNRVMNQPDNDNSDNNKQQVISLGVRD